MAIELVGDRKLLDALEVESEKPNRASNSVPNASRSRYGSVSIPDIRYHNLSAVTENPPGNQATSEIKPVSVGPQSATEPVHNKATNSRPITSLKSIKESIEHQTGKSVNDLIDEIAEVDRRGDSHRDKPVMDSDGELMPKLSKDCFLSRLKANDRQIVPIAESIIGKFPLGGASIIAFAGTERNEQLEMVVAGTALTLNHLKQCKVLIIDSEIGEGFLTGLMNCESKTGLTDLAKGGCTWQGSIESTCRPDIHFLPVGNNEAIYPETMISILKKTIPNVIGKYDYVIVNVGDAHDTIAEMWSNYTNGTFLVVSMLETNQNIAKSAVAQLNSFGARLVGCVVSDAST